MVEKGKGGGAGKGKGKPPAKGKAASKPKAAAKGKAASKGKAAAKGQAAPKRKSQAKGAKSDQTAVRPAVDETAKRSRSDETGDYELGDDFLEDLEPGQEPPEDERGAAEEEYDEEAIVSAETQEWTPEDVEDKPAEEDEEPSEAEETLVVAAEEDEDGRDMTGAVRSGVTDGFGAVKSGVTGGFRAIGRIRLPLWARFLTASLLIIVSVATATSVSGLLFLSDFAEALRHHNRLDEVRNRLTEVEGGAPQTILIIGSDLQPVGSSKKFQGLSDTTMLLRLDPDRDAIALFSLPRDLRVSIPGYGVAKLNEAYTAGGPELTLKTIQNLTRSPQLPNGIEVNHLVNVDFTGFARAVNEIDCVYVDVDRRYFHSNDNTSALGDYDEIDIQPGYQALCGLRALDFVRYRHEDNDVVRAARQQDFLREARQKVPPTQLFIQRGKLIDIFTEHTTSDVKDAAELLDVLKLFIEARNAPVKEIHFEGTLGPSFVDASEAEIDKAVQQFLGLEDTAGSRAKSAKPTQPVSAEGEGQSKGTPATKPKKKKAPGSLDDANVAPSTYGRQLAEGMRKQRKFKLPIYYPTVLEASSDYADKPRVYKINGTGRGSPPNGERLAYKWVFSLPALGEYYGFMGTKWKDPPILENPSEEREIGDRTYKLFYDGDRLRLVAWQDDNGSFWVSNTLTQSLSDRELIEIARGMKELEK